MLAEAEQPALQFQYNDHLASLKLMQAWAAIGNKKDRDAALDYVKMAMVYALRYNRFLLDEVLNVRPQGTPLRPIIPHLVAQEDQGRKTLGALREWWKVGVNDTGMPRADTISPIPEGIALVEAERIAREREPGDGAAQKSVIEQIEAAL